MSDTNDANNIIEEEDFFCGIVMPISNHTDYPHGHWTEVLKIIEETMAEVVFNPPLNLEVKIVSESREVLPIQSSIVNNLYDADLVICDVSSANPNVFFELGMRLTFDKPVIIIKDEKTNIAFDISPIKYIQYDSSLRYQNVNTFKSELKEAIMGTILKTKEDPNYSPFLKHFSEIEFKPNEAMAPSELSVPPYIEVLFEKMNNIEQKQNYLYRFTKNTDNKQLDKKHDVFNSFSDEERAIYYNAIALRFGSDGRFNGDSLELSSFLDALTKRLDEQYILYTDDNVHRVLIFLRRNGIIQFGKKASN